jgi:hypothetical protein
MEAKFVPPADPLAKPPCLAQPLSNAMITARCLLVALCMALRVIPHAPNFAPVGAAAVFSGRAFGRKSAFLVVAASMLLSDLVLACLHGYALFDLVTPFVYAGFGIQTLLGRQLRARKGGALLAAALGGLGFFALSNLGVWLASGMYPLSWVGFTTCYVAALPFLVGTLAGDLLWTAALCLAYRPLAVAWHRLGFWVLEPVSEPAAL